MLTTNPDSGQPPRISFESAVERLVEDVVQDFRALAKIPELEALPDRLERETHEKSMLYEVLVEWMRVQNEDRVYPPELVNLFNRTKRDALALQQQLEKLLSSLEDEGMLDSTEKDTLASAAGSLSETIKKIDNVRHSQGLPPDRPFEFGKRRGRPSAATSLQFLVGELELFARGFGGKGFGTPSTQPKKGRIIQMLDRLRKRFIDDPGLQWLADFLPAPGTHPISVYQRVIKKARTDYAELDLTKVAFF